jgi:hypothetical protein
MGADFRVRGGRMDEQIDLLRRLWTEESVTSIMGTIHQGLRPAQAMLDEVAAWADLGATHLNIRTATCMN